MRSKIKKVKIQINKKEMKLSQFIKGLKEFKEQYGDYDVISSSDSEGNSFGEVMFEPTAVKIKELGEYIHPQEIEYDVKKEEFNAVIIN